MRWLNMVLGHHILDQVSCPSYLEYSDMTHLEMMLPHEERNKLKNLRYILFTATRYRILKHVITTS